MRPRWYGVLCYGIRDKLSTHFCGSCVCRMVSLETCSAYVVQRQTGYMYRETQRNKFKFLHGGQK